MNDNVMAMTISFLFRHGLISETVVDQIRAELMKLPAPVGDSSRAEVFVDEDMSFQSGKKICMIRLRLPADELMAYCRTDDFRKSASGALKSLRKLIRFEMAGCFRDQCPSLEESVH